MTSTSSALPAIAWRRDPIVERFPFFYGWMMLPMATIAQLVTSPGQTFGISVFNSSFSSALNLSQSQLTGAYGLGTLLACLPLPLVGMLMDRWGIRRSMSVVVFLFGCACLFTSQVSGLVTLFLAFFFLRMLGQGALSLLAGNTLAMWFHNRLGTVSGLMSVTVVVVMGQLPRLFRQLIENFGWRWTYAILGISVWAVMFPLLAIFFRNRPEESGQLPDGAAADDTAKPRAEKSEDDQQGPQFDLLSAMRTVSFWIILAVHVVWAMVGTGLVFNIQKMFQSRGLSVSSADYTLTVLFICIAVMQLTGGFLADRIRVNWLIWMGTVGMASGIALLIFGEAGLTSFAYAVFGLSQGLLGAAGNTVWVRYFGRAHLGKIRGTAFMAIVAGSSLGPFIMGLALDISGSYRPALFLFLALYAPLVVSAMFATAPVRRPHSAAC